MSNILQHNIERFGMVTVMDVVLYEIGAGGVQGAPKLFLDTLKMTNISTEGNNKEIRGGIGNDMLISYDYGRTATIEIQDALLSPASLKVLFGAVNDEVVKEISHNLLVQAGTILDTEATGNIKAGSIFIFPTDGSAPQVVDQATSTIMPTIAKKSRVLWIQVGADSTTEAQTQTFEVEPTNENVDLILNLPTATAVASVKDVNGTDIPFVFNLATRVLTINSFTLDNATEGEATIAFTAQVASGAIGDFKEIRLTNDNFPLALKLVGTSFVIEESTGKKKRIQIEIPKFKINSNFAFTMDAEGEASVFDFNGVALVQDGELMKIQFLGEYDYDINLV